MDFSQLFDRFVNQKAETSCQRGSKRSSDGWRIDGVYLRYPNHPVRGHLSFFFLPMLSPQPVGSLTTTNLFLTLITASQETVKQGE